MKSLKNVMKTVFVILGTLIGAGFASGKEIYSFFFIYNLGGVIGIVISSLIISLVIYKVFNICNKYEIDSYENFCNCIVRHKKSLAKLLNNIVNIFLLITFFIMVAGFVSLLKQELGINKLIGSVIILIFNYIVCTKNVNGLVKLSNYLIPIFIIFLLIISVKSGNALINFSPVFNKDKNLIEAIIKSILYASYNCIILIPVLVLLKKQNNKKRNIILVCVINFAIIVGLIMCIYNLLMLGNTHIYALEMPIIGIIQNMGNVYKYIYIILIAISIFTTTSSSCITFLNNVTPKNNKFENSLLIISILAIPFSQISFGTLVNLIYPVLGGIGILEIILIWTHHNTVHKT